MKVRSKKITDGVRGMSCELRVASLFGMTCASDETVVAAHLPGCGSGMGTKASDLHIVAACHTCHGILDRVAIADMGLTGPDSMPGRADAFWRRVITGSAATIDALVGKGLITVPGAKIRKGNR
jgi:hypothetical protein